MFQKSKNLTRASENKRKRRREGASQAERNSRWLASRHDAGAAAARGNRQSLCASRATGARAEREISLGPGTPSDKSHSRIRAQRNFARSSAHQKSHHKDLYSQANNDEKRSCQGKKRRTFLTSNSERLVPTASQSIVGSPKCNHKKDKTKAGRTPASTKG